MYYKFVGAHNESALVEIFDNAVVGGSVKFGAVHAFNDPYEFKFESIAPTRAQFDEWHQVYDAERSAEELENAWSALTGSQKHWNAALNPRLEMMRSLYVLCLAQRWDSHLMWGHYTASHSGFVICYRDETLQEFSQIEGYEGQGNVTYSDEVPTLKWFSGPPSEMLAPILGTKSKEWAYELEHRTIIYDADGSGQVFRKIDPHLISGVIIGLRSPEILIKKAFDYKKNNPDFIIEQVTSKRGGYNLDKRLLEEKARLIFPIL